MAKTDENPEAAESPDSGGQAEGSAGADKGENVQPPEARAEVSKDARMWAMLCHLLGLFTNFIGPLVLWLIKKDEDSFIDQQGKEALNFQITVAIAMIISTLLIFACVGMVLVPAVGVVDLIFCILASVKANNGEAYRYPLTIRFIK